LGKLENPDPKTNADFVILKPGDSFAGKLDGAILPDGTYVKVTDKKDSPVTPNFSVENGDGKNPSSKLKFDSLFDFLVNAIGDFLKGFSKDKKGDTSGVFPNKGEGHPVAQWSDEVDKAGLTDPKSWEGKYQDRAVKSDQQKDSQ
jgi:hypothetical protein